MLTGTVDEGTPHLRIDFAGRIWTAIVDTGFNGDLELPESLFELLNPRFGWPAETILASGIAIDEDVYLVDFPFDGRTVVAEATFAPVDQILIGTKLIEQYCLEIHFPNATLHLERVAPAGTTS